MLIFIIELITEFIYVLHKFNIYVAPVQKIKISKYIGFESNVKFHGHVGFLLNT